MKIFYTLIHLLKDSILVIPIWIKNLWRKYHFIYKKTHIKSIHMISNDSNIGKYCYIWHNTSITKSSIGNYCSIANNVSIWMWEHDINAISTSSLFYSHPYQILTQKECIIWNDVWIWVDSIIRRWVSIWNGAIIGGNSFVNTDIPAYAIAVWSPAKVIKYRFKKEKIEKIEKSQWWKYDQEKAKSIINSL